jgi:putative salt-induced outer membrane protein YdiY
MFRPALFFAVAVLLTPAISAFAQDTCPCPPEPPPEPPWKTNIGFGFTHTTGNTDSQNLNLTFDVIHDPKTKNVFKADGLWIRNKTDGELSSDRGALTGRDEYTFSGRTFAFGELGYQQDAFKELDYLVTPLAGIGHHLFDSDRFRLTVDGSIGGAFERLFEQDSTSDGTFKVGQSLRWQISESARLTQSAWGLWKFADTADSYYHFDVSLSSSVTGWMEVKLSLVDDYKNKPASPELEKNDLALLANLVLKL